MDNRKGLFILAGLVVMLMALPVLADDGAETGTPTGTPSIGNCTIFPADNIWNTPVDTLPVDANSDAYIDTLGRDTGLHPDFGAALWEGAPIGIPYTLVPPGQSPVDISFYYPEESDPGPYPIPSDAPIEGGTDSDGDRHVLLVDEGDCRLYEIYDAYPLGDDTWEAGSGAIWDLSGNALRPEGWTSADAAGLPILPGLVRYEEVAAGEIRHAIRFTASNIRSEHLWPARHDAECSAGDNTDAPAYGQRFRLKDDFKIDGYSPQTQVILQAMKTYGLVLADCGSDWYISGVPNEGWNNDTLVRELRSISGDDFEAVDVSSLMVNVNSAQADLPAVVLVSPANGANVNITQAILDWADVPGTASYDIQLSTTNPPQAMISGLTASRYSTPPLGGDTYYWRVRAYPAAGGVSAWSRLWSFNVISAPSAIPARDHFTTGAPILSWNAISWATRYEVQIATNSGFSPLAYSNNQIAPNTLQITVNPPLTNNTYYWRVRARQTDGVTWGAWSAVNTFVVDAP